MATYIIDKNYASTEKEHLDLDGKHIKGNLEIIGTNYRTISIEKSKIDGCLIVINNKSNLELSNSTILGSILLFKIKGSGEIHLDGLNTIENLELDVHHGIPVSSEFHSNDDNYTINITENEISLNQQKTDSGNKINFTATKDLRIKIDIDGNDNDFIKKLFSKDDETKALTLSPKSVLIYDIQAQINLDDSIFGGNVIIVDSSTTTGTLGISNTTFKDKLSVVGVGIASDIKARNSNFKGEVFFNDNRFDNEVYFANSTFDKLVTFKDCTFYQEIYLQTAKFKSPVEFSQSIFQSKVSFREIEFDGDKSTMKIYNGSAFQGYVDFTGQDFSKYEFRSVRGLRNIFYSMVQDEGNEFKSKSKSIALDKSYPNIQKCIPKLHDWINTVKNKTTMSDFNRQIEIFVEGRRAMEDLAKEELVSEFHVLEMEAQRRKSYEENNYLKTFRLWFLKVSTNYGESPFRIILFILFDWLFFTVLYFMALVINPILHLDASESLFKHYKPSDLDPHNFSLLNQMGAAMLQSTNNLLSLNSFFPCSCNMLVIFITLLQGFINIMIVALMVQVVFRKLDLR